MNELLFKTRLSQQQQMLAETVQKSGDDLLALINDVLDFSKIEAGKLQLEAHEFSLPQLVEDTVALLSSTAADKGLSLYVDIEYAAAWKVRSDEFRLRQILMNLVGNAIKFTERGSVTLRVTVAGEEDGKGSFVFQITDTGVGMDAVAQERIFSAFYQTDGSNTRQHSGTGLGLSIVNQLMALFQGDISVTSQPGAGSCFQLTFSLPLVEACDLALPDSLHGQSLLVHLADPVAQKLLADRLRSLGLRVTEVDSAEGIIYQLGRAARSAQPFSFALFSANQKLPDGQLLYAAIRADSTLLSLRRILLSGREDSLALQKCEQKLYRPVGWSDLQETLSRSWHELHLVEKSPERQLLSTVSGGGELPRILLAGTAVASRELIRISLAELALQVDVVANTQQFSEHLAMQTYAALIFDLTRLPVAEFLLVHAAQQISTPVYILHAANDDLDEIAPVATGLLAKPVTRGDLQKLLQPVLDLSFDHSGRADGGEA